MLPGGFRMTRGGLARGQRLLERVVAGALDVVLGQHGDDPDLVQPAEERPDVGVLLALVDLLLALHRPYRRADVGEARSAFLSLTKIGLPMPPPRATMSIFAPAGSSGLDVLGEARGEHVPDRAQRHRLELELLLGPRQSGDQAAGRHRAAAREEFTPLHGCSFPEVGHAASRTSKPAFRTASRIFASSAPAVGLVGRRTTGDFRIPASAIADFIRACASPVGSPEP